MGSMAALVDDQAIAAEQQQPSPAEYHGLGIGLSSPLLVGPGSGTGSVGAGVDVDEQHTQQQQQPTGDYFQLRPPSSYYPPSQPADGPWSHQPPSYQHHVPKPHGHSHSHSSEFVPIPLNLPPLPAPPLPQQQPLSLSPYAYQQPQPQPHEPYYHQVPNFHYPPTPISPGNLLPPPRNWTEHNRGLSSSSSSAGWYSGHQQQGQWSHIYDGPSYHRGHHHSLSGGSAASVGLGAGPGPGRQSNYYRMEEQQHHRGPPCPPAADIGDLATPPLGSAAGHRDGLRTPATGGDGGQNWGLTPSQTALASAQGMNELFAQLTPPASHSPQPNPQQHPQLQQHQQQGMSPLRASQAGKAPRSSSAAGHPPTISRTLSYGHHQPVHGSSLEHYQLGSGVGIGGGGPGPLELSRSAAARRTFHPYASSPGGYHHPGHGRSGSAHDFPPSSLSTSPRLPGDPRPYSPASTHSGQSLVLDPILEGVSPDSSSNPSLSMLVAVPPSRQGQGQGQGQGQVGAAAPPSASKSARRPPVAVVAKHKILPIVPYTPSEVVHKNDKGKKVYVCQYGDCRKDFSRIEHLRRHERTHTMERPFMCDYPECGRYFSRMDNMSQHRKTHEKALFPRPPRQPSNGVSGSGSGKSSSSASAAKSPTKKKAAAAAAAAATTSTMSLVDLGGLPPLPPLPLPTMEEVMLQQQQQQQATGQGQGRSQSARSQHPQGGGASTSAVIGRKTVRSAAAA